MGHIYADIVGVCVLARVCACAWKNSKNIFSNDIKTEFVCGMRKGMQLKSSGGV